jgi:hypothetical protein
MHLVQLPHDHPGALALLQAAMRFAVDAPAGQVLQASAVIKPGANVLGIEDDAGQLRGAFVLTPLATPYGVIVRCNAAGGAADQDLTAFMADATEAMAKAHGAVAAQCLTQRRGLVKKLKARGYRVAGYVLQKDVP